jgi:hypothetical protein
MPLKCSWLTGEEVLAWNPLEEGKLEEDGEGEAASVEAVEEAE